MTWLGAPVRRRFVVIALVVGLLVVAAFVMLHGRGGSVPVTGPRGQRVTLLHAGDCFNGLEEGVTGMYVTKVSCQRPHEGEVGVVTAVAGGPYPGDAALVAVAGKACKKRIGFMPDDRRGDDLEVRIDRPQPEAWKRGDRAVGCVLRRTGAQASASTPSPGWKDIAELRSGECVKKWRLDDGEAFVDCRPGYERRVLGVFTLSGDAWPGRSTEFAMVKEGCGALRGMVFGGRRVRERRPGQVQPSRAAWEDHRRSVVCLVADHGGVAG
ncbi:septum formation family protein [Actinomadura opuntiae]|uniref:septum formation family protein n=1 Tax=Actinomadura sp. OS1-43 TaxID=604315 RepID=UPI00255AB93A|nr:septum formation family protein [Actinomadura sp. OS1-43]MDL4818024.1 septum formation family protein [Actinomadura sp. OS1-43]